MGGAWQLVFTVRNPAPAVPKIVVEQLSPEGQWREIFGLFLVEFRARAARPRARLAYRLSAPVEWRGLPARPPRLRFAARGFGRILVEDVFLTDGMERYAPPFEASGPVALGREAPRQGFPDFDWEENRGVWEPQLTFPGQQTLQAGFLRGRRDPAG